MASLWYYFSVRDNSNTGLGLRVTGLTPMWSLFNALDTNTPIIPQPVIVEVGQGIYKYLYDTEIDGEVAGQIDALGGGNLTKAVLNPGDRYIDQFPTRESSRLLSAVNSAGQVALSPTGLESVVVDAVITGGNVATTWGVQLKAPAAPQVGGA